MKIILVAFDVIWVVSLFVLAATNGVMNHTHPVSHSDITTLYFHGAVLAARVVFLERK